MAEQNKFGNMPHVTPGGGGLRCEEWEALLADALDGLLPAREAAAFQAHGASCAGCADLLAHAKQGQEWLEYLHTEPEVPSDLLGRILDRTAGAGAIPVPVIAGAPQGAGALAMAVPFRRSFHETRLMMTVAMAFFSIALTLNLAGVKFSSLRMADLRPAAIGGALSRQFYGARGQVVRYYQNLRFVYQLESRLRELRRDAETAPANPQPETPRKNEPSKQGGSKDGSLNSSQERGQVLAAQQQQGSQDTEEQPKHTEVRVSETTGSPISLDQQTAGPRRDVAVAGYDGRSLA